MYQRRIAEKFLKSTEVSPAVLLNGSRQTGKSTLVQTLLKETHKYYTFDDINVLNTVRGDPLAFLNAQKRPIIIDEVQRYPDILLSIKKKIDENRQAGQVILTGSANVLGLPTVSESLAGRMEIHTLWPLSPVEIYNIEGCFIDKVFGELDFSLHKHIDSLDVIFAGGYPDVLKRETDDSKNNWCHAYIQTLLYRDVRDLAHIEKLTELPDLLSLLAARSASLLNTSELSRNTHLPNTTLKRYLKLLELLYFSIEVPAWSKNFSKRLIKSSKTFMNDIQILLYLLGANRDSVLKNRVLFGQVLETFVAQELSKQQTWAQKRTRLYHYRTQAGGEIDFILEAFDGSLVAIEVKASQTLDMKFFRHIKELQQEIPVRGIVLYTGHDILPCGPDLWALPIASLWA